MRQIPHNHDALQRPPQRWHERFDAPCAEEEIEVDFGDCLVWSGVRYAPEVECFVDADSGAPVPVLMWRYSARRPL